MHEIAAIVRKDVRIELRSRVVITQVLPFAMIVLILFGLALDADRSTLRSFTPGLFWVTVLFASILAIQRSVSVETAASAFEALRLSGAAGWKVFVGKAVAVAAQLIAIETAMLGGVIVFYRSSVDEVVLLVTSALAATLAIAAAGSLYGVLAVGSGVRDTILPMLLLPILAPVLVAATRAFGDAMGATAVNGWSWCALLACFALLYGLVGSVAYGVVLEDA